MTLPTHPDFILGADKTFVLVEALVFISLFLLSSNPWTLLGLLPVHLCGIFYTWRKMKRFAADPMEEAEIKQKNDKQQ